jgi:hypothetical protein
VRKELDRNEYIITKGWDTTISKNSMELNMDHGGTFTYTFLEGYRDVMEMGRAIDPSEVYSITIGDTEIGL